MSSGNRNARFQFGLGPVAAGCETLGMATNDAERAFIAWFQPRLRAAREQAGLSQAGMAKGLGIGLNAYKKMEWRDTSAFPLYLVPDLVRLTGRPFDYWLGPDPRLGGPRLKVVK